MSTRDQQSLSLERGLLDLLSKLEYIRSGMENQQTQKWPTEILRLSDEAVSIVSQFAEERKITAIANADTKAVVNLLQQFRDSQKKIREQLPAKTRAGFFGLFSKAKVAMNADQQELLKQSLNHMIEILQNYFTLFTGQIRASGSSNGWVETASIFIVDFRRVVRDLVDPIT